MVKIAIAAASGELAGEVIEALVATGKHEMLGLVRKDPSTLPSYPGLTWVQTQYDNKDELVDILKGVNTIICFIDPIKDVGGENQKKLIDAAVAAGVPRYMPSEWFVGDTLEANIGILSWYASKLAVRKYLAEINRDRQVIEYTLVWPGGFMNYLGYPHKTSRHVTLFPSIINLESHTAIAVEGHEDAYFNFTTVADIGRIVAAIVEHEGPWPVHGGVRGHRLTQRELIRLIGEVTGRPLEVETVRVEDLREGKLLVKKVPLLAHSSIPPEQLEHFSRMMITGFLLVVPGGAWDSSDEWNRLLPDFKFTTIQEFLTPLFQKKE